MTPNQLIDYNGLKHLGPNGGFAHALKARCFQRYVFMRKVELKPRVFDTKTYYRHLKNTMACAGDFLHARRSGNVDKAFAEKIMLAVTEVNGCRYCNYIHTKKAIDAGVSEEDIQALFNGQFENLPPDQAHALIFAQHYADTGGYPDPDTYQKFKQYYGEEKAKDIMAIIKSIMMGNITSLSIEALKNRLRRHPVPGSRFKDEFLIIFGTFLFIPIICVQLLFNKIFKSFKKLLCFRS